MRVLTSLKSRLALAGAALIALSVVLGALAALRLVDTHINDAVLDNEAAQARTLARVASNRLVARQLTLRRLGEDMPASLADPQAIVEWLRGKTVLLPTFDSLLVIDPQGQGVAIANDDGVRTSDANLTDRPYFRQTVELRVPRISDPITSRISGHPSIVFTQPLFDGAGRVRAVLCATLRLASRDLLADLAEDDRTDDSGHLTAIIDREGRLIAHPNPALALAPAEQDPRLMPALRTWRDSGVLPEPTGYALRANQHIVALAGIAVAEWIVVRSIDEERTLGGIAQARRRAVALALLTAALGGAALWGTTLWLMRPLDRLKRRATSTVLDGPESTEPWPIESGEIGELARVLREAERRNREGMQERAKLLQQMEMVLENASVGLLVTMDRKMVLVSGALNRLFGYAEGELVGKPARILFASDEIYDALGAQVGADFARQGKFDAELRFVRRDGRLMWCRLMGRPVEHGNPDAGTIWVIDDVTAAREQREQLEWASTHDSLTRLANRAAFEQALNRHLADRRTASAKQPFCVLLMDLDHFKAVNDRGGHAAGDALLRELSALMSKRLRRSDLLARLGGDEFGAILDNCDEATALRVADSMREQVAQYKLHWHGEEHAVGVSIGVVEASPAYHDGAAVMAAADEACYAAKGAGRNQVRAAARTDPRMKNDFVASRVNDK